MENTALVNYNWETNTFTKADDDDFVLGIYEANTRGAEKNITWLTSLVDVAAEISATIRDSGVLRWTEPLAKATLIAAPLCAIPEAVGYGIRSARQWVKLATDATVSNLQKAAATTLKMAQRLIESLYGMMKLGVMDAALSVATKSI